MNEDEQIAARSRLHVEAFRAPHGPEVPYTDDEIRASLERHGADRTDMMVQDPDRYFAIAKELRNNRLVDGQHVETVRKLGVCLLRRLTGRG